ncbi:hypothetical protein Clacol_001340 [Clathrus columnatus]|uniref:Uncharacterized protein n=1 Tax=Clathrus columnatus TaxID=1419009 RepID=A0AAV4ZYZ3_9AGAM|nr:hypothetical protein Clacol_001340 [Clathrus columnatus]
MFWECDPYDRDDIIDQEFHPDHLLPSPSPTYSSEDETKYDFPYPIPKDSDFPPILYPTQPSYHPFQTELQLYIDLGEKYPLMSKDISTRRPTVAASSIPSVVPDQAPTPPAAMKNNNIDYPAFDKFFEDLPEAIKAKCDTGSILAQLTDARIYHIDELEAMTDTELQAEGLALGDVEGYEGL